MKVKKAVSGGGHGSSSGVEARGTPAQAHAAARGDSAAHVPVPREPALRVYGLEEAAVAAQGPPRRLADSRIVSSPLYTPFYPCSPGFRHFVLLCTIILHLD